jgi:hypothetical protein
VVSFAAALPDHPWLDRVVRGRAWIPLLGVLLAGIIAAQVEILKLGATMGRALEQTSTLTTQNEQLRWNVAQLGDDQRIERMAGTMGLVLPPPGAVGYIAAKPGGDVAGALANIHAQDASAFVAMAPHNGALVTGPGTSTLPPPLGTPAPTSTTSTTSTTSATAATASTTTTTTATTATTTPATSSALTTSQVSSASSGSATTTTGTTDSVQPAASPSTGAAAIQPTGASQQTGGG